MARPMRKDADYFPFICKEGKTFSILRNRYPLEGIGFFTELCIILTTTPDHHIQLKTDLDFEYLCSKMKCDKSKAESIIDLLVMTGKMHKELWEKANVILIPDLLDSLKDAYERRTNEIITIKELINVYINPLNDNKNPESVPQKPLKDSKVNKIKINNDNKDIKHKYGEYNHVLLTDSQMISVVEKLGDHKTKYMIKVMDEAIEEKGNIWHISNFAMALLKWAKKDTSYKPPQQTTPSMPRLPRPPKCPTCGKPTIEYMYGGAGCKPCGVMFRYNDKWIREK